MILKTEDLWTALGQVDLILVSGNSTVNKHNRLVMGTGAAKEAAERYPCLPRELGAKISTNFPGPRAFYGVLAVKPPGVEDMKVGVLQVKYHWREAARLELIDSSLAMLLVFLRQAVKAGHPRTVALNFPGIGAGRLNRATVWPLLKRLPDSIWIYERPVPI